MKLASFEVIVQALNEAKVRYLIVGGIAVNAHGFLRFTKDVDLVIQLSQANIEAALRALESIGYFPAQPVSAQQFADPAVRESWRKDKQMLVLKMWSDSHRETPLDIFVYEPFDFDAEYQLAYSESDPDTANARFVSIPTLIAMKTEAGRPQDLIDIEKLRQILKFSTDGN